jgi:hypothetical protein
MLTPARESLFLAGRDLEHHYWKMNRDERNERLQRIGAIGAPNVFFGDDDDETDDADKCGEGKP